MTYTNNNNHYTVVRLAVCAAVMVAGVTADSGPPITASMPTTVETTYMNADCTGDVLNMFYRAADFGRMGAPEGVTCASESLNGACQSGITKKCAPTGTTYETILAGFPNVQAQFETGTAPAAGTDGCKSVEPYFINVYPTVDGKCMGSQTMTCTATELVTTVHDFVARNTCTGAVNAESSEKLTLNKCVPLYEGSTSRFEQASCRGQGAGLLRSGVKYTGNGGAISGHGGSAHVAPSVLAAVATATLAVVSALLLA